MTQTNATWYVIRSVAIIKSLNWSLQKCFGNYVVDIHHCATFCPDFFVHQCMTSCTVYTCTYLTALFPGLPGSASNKKVKPIWILLKQETVSGSGISWAICKCAPCSRQITMPAPHHSVFLQAGCPSCRPTNSIKALKALLHALFIQV